MTDILICSYLEPAHIERIQRTSADLRVHFRPDLVPKPRYEADHVGYPLSRSPEQQREWRALMKQAEILFDFDHADLPGMIKHAKHVRWIQASSAGIGQFVKRHGLHTLPAIITTAAGVHTRPLTEFVFWGILTFIKNYPRAKAQQERRHWERFHNDDLEGKTLAIVGLGSIGREIARTARHFGMCVTATKRDISNTSSDKLGIDKLYTKDQLHAMLAEVDVVVLILPHTPETQGVFDAKAFDAMKPGAIFINIGRGAVVDEQALMGALSSGKLQGAVLDVVAQEPLPTEHPLWRFDNVFIFPHSASTSKNENRRMVDLFLENLERYQLGQPLKNVFDLKRFY